MEKTLQGKDMKFIIGLLLNALLFTLSWIVPKKKGSILCGGGMGERFSGNPKYFFLYLHRLNQKGETPFREYFWITKNNSLLQTMKTQNLPVISGFSFTGFWKILRSEFLIIESGPAMKKFGHDIGYQRLFMGRFKIIQTWHGSGGKRILLDALKDRGFNHFIDHIYFYLERMELQNLWCILTMGEREQSFMKQAFDNNNVYIIGYPKNDLLVQKFEKWGLKKEWTSYDKVILYAPTFREANSEKQAFSSSFFPKINQFLKEKNWIFLVKKHPFDIYLNIPKHYTHIKDVTTFYDDIQVLLAQTDLLISDYSSVSIDFLLTKKPILFYAYDYEIYQKLSRKLHYDLLQDAPGAVCKTEEDLLQAIQNIDEESAHYQAIYKKNITIFHRYTDGHSCHRLLQCILTNKHL